MSPASPKLATPGAARPDDPSVKVGINLPASLLHKLRDHAALIKSSVSALCRDGALREIERIEAERIATGERR